MHEKTFGKELEDNWEESITGFEESYAKTGLSITPKVHYITRHIGPWCKRKGCGLGYLDE